MLGIKVDNEFLDLLPGTQLEMEQNNPYMQFTNEIAGEYSLPIELPATTKNIRLLKYASLLQTRADKISIDCGVYANGFQHSIGKLRIEKPTIHLNNAKRGNITVYYITGISSFYKDIQNLRLRDINAGGVRTFTNDNFNTAGAGFWGHIHSVINASPGYEVSGFDYAFFPCTNTEWRSDGLVDIINKVELSGGNPVFSQYVQRGVSDFKIVNPIIPFPYLKYVMNRAAAYAGWRIEGTALDDADFKKIVLWSQRSIKWGYVRAVGGFSPHLDWLMYDSIKFDLKDFLPDVSIAEFLLAIKNRLGLWYDFDRINKIIRVKKIIDVSASTIKDMSAAANPLVTKTVLSKTKTFSIRTIEDIGPFDTSKVDYQGAVDKYSDLPAAAEALVEKVYMVTTENNFYICQQNESTTNWEWGILTTNMGGVGPDDADEKIETAALITGSEKANSYLELIPRRDEAGIRDGILDGDVSASIVLLFNHGRQNNSLGQSYPFGSHNIYTPAGVLAGNWSLAFKAKKFDGTEVGLWDVFFKKFIDTITAGEEFDITLNLSFAVFLQLKFSDIISINNVRIYILELKPTLPYKHQVVLKCSRVS
jgi:hypothetical protein